jgi:hypothetical protein
MSSMRFVLQALCLLVVATAFGSRAAADPKIQSNLLKSAFHMRSASLILQSIGSSNELKVNGDALLSACRYAADIAARVQAVRAPETAYAEIGDRMLALATEGREWIRERQKVNRAILEARVLKERMRRKTEATDGAELRRIAAEIAGIGGAEPCLRAVDLYLEAAHYAKGARAPALDALSELAARMEQDGLDAATVAAARAAVELEQALDDLEGESADPARAKSRVAGVLKSLAPHLKDAQPDVSIVRRHNDAVSLALAHPDWQLEARYHLFYVDAPREGLRIGIPLSREWQVLRFGATLYKPGTGIAVGEHISLSIWQQSPDGRLRRDVLVSGYDFDHEYPVGNPLKKRRRKVSGKSPKGLAAAQYAFEKTLVKSERKASGPKVRRLAHLKATHHYEVYGLNGRKQFRRYRGWYFRTKPRTFGVRVRDNEDFGLEVDDGLQALLDGLTPTD